MQENKKLRENIVKCDAWVLSKLEAIPESKVESEYERKDGTKVPIAEVAYDNGMTFQVSESRFWKKRE